MNPQQFKQLSQQLAGIELPPEPNWWPLIWSISGIIITLLIIALFIYKKDQTRRNKTLAEQAPQRLRQIQQQWQNGELDQRTTAYQLATLLRIGLGLKQLNQNTPALLSNQHAQWQMTIKLLQQMRYQASSNAKLDEQLFATIHHWLKQGRSTC